VDAATAATKRAGLEREVLARQIAARVKLAYWGAEGAERARSVLDETLRTFAQIVAYHEARVRKAPWRRPTYCASAWKASASPWRPTRRNSRPSARASNCSARWRHVLPAVKFEEGSDELEVALPEVDVSKAARGAHRDAAWHQAIEQARTRLDLSAP
jgi:hypothetical protein